MPVRDLLLLLVRGTSLSIVPDPAIAGSFIGELKNVTVRQALGLILPPLGLDYARGRQRRPRVPARAGDADLRPQLHRDRARRARRRWPATAGRGPAPASRRSTKTDVFDDLANGVRTLLSERATFNVDRKAGLLQVTDFPERLDRVAIYLDAVQDRVHRQVQIDARVIEVELNDEKAAGIDWAGVAAKMSGAATADVPVATRQTMNGLRVTDVAQAAEPARPSRAR